MTRTYDRDMQFSQSIGAAEDRAAVRLVSVDPHSCCFGSDRRHGSTCGHPRYAFSIKSWTMNLSMEEQLTWVKDDEIDCQELWALPGYDLRRPSSLTSPVPHRVLGQPRCRVLFGLQLSLCQLPRLQGMDDPAQHKDQEAAFCCSVY